jgi:hypothetical protein
MATPRKKLPDHVTWALELAEGHQARIARLLDEANRVMTDRRGINKWALEALLAKIAESNATIGQALHSIERRDPPPDDGASPTVDRAWLMAMDRLAGHESGNGTLETMRAFIRAKLTEFEQGEWQG